MAGGWSWALVVDFKSTDYKVVQSLRECSWIGGNFAVKDVRLIEKKTCQIADVLIPPGLPGGRQQSHQLMLHIQFEDRLGAASAVLSRKQTIQLTVLPLRAGHQAGRTLCQAL